MEIWDVNEDGVQISLLLLDSKNEEIETVLETCLPKTMYLDQRVDHSKNLDNVLTNDRSHWYFFLMTTPTNDPSYI